jgi:hypothetical protein
MAILRRLEMSDESESKITLETIEEHIKKIEKDAILASYLHSMGLALLMILAGIAITWTNAGIGLFIIGAIYLVFVSVRHNRNMRTLNLGSA